MQLLPDLFLCKWSKLKSHTLKRKTTDHREGEWVTLPEAEVQHLGMPQVLTKPMLQREEHIIRVLSCPWLRKAAVAVTVPGPDPAVLASSRVPLPHPCLPQALGWQELLPSWRAGRTRGGVAAPGLGPEQALHKPHLHCVVLAGKNKRRLEVMVPIFTLQQTLPQNIHVLQHASSEAKIHPPPHFVLEQAIKNLQLLALQLRKQRRHTHAKQ